MLKKLIILFFKKINYFLFSCVLIKMSSLSTCKNSFYTRIQAFGTASAFDPHYIMKAGSIGPPNGESCGSSSQENTNTINVKVNLADHNMCDIICLGVPIPRNCVPIYVSMNGNRTITDSTFTASLGYGVGLTGSVGCNNKPIYFWTILDNPPEAGPIIGNYMNNTYINDGYLNLFTDPAIRGKTAQEWITVYINTSNTCGTAPTTTLLNSFDGLIYPCLRITGMTNPPSPSPSPCCPCPCPQIIDVKMTFLYP
jgi:hypothetical protein